MSNRTKHFKHRMDQRCISHTMIQIVENLGYFSLDGERLLIDKKSLITLEIWVRSFLKQVELMKSRGGLTLVEVDGKKITVFDNNSYKKNLRRLQNV